MIYTGERIIPLLDGGNIQEHLDTLNLALPFCKGSVLDAACGCGWASSHIGSDTLYVGIDISQEAIDYAIKNFNRNFVQGSVLDLPFKNEIFDTCISIETFEHVKRNEVEKMIFEFYRVLKTNGVYFFSTPDGTQFPYQPKDESEYIGYHFWHYTESEIRDLLRMFRTVLIGKRDNVGSLIVIAYK